MCYGTLYVGFYVFLISLLFVKELATVKSNFGEQFNQQLKHLITEFADITEEPQGLPPHRGHLVHKMKLTSYPPRHRKKDFHCLSMKSLNNTVLYSLKRAKYGSRAALMLLLMLWFGSQVVQSEFALIIARLMNAR